ncbi:protein YgfX [Candidatus Parabeggiatoa sp. HSG14]|uniref:protein YgfX n=1 Tax=Candidatus Parabeggiatoa sp. HSG14 TaxID=3055593 RepID=UPI0025A74D2D|nr:hypothetical protein [Thiotrichales bacterium HSG14]
MSNFTIALCIKPRFSKRFALVLIIIHCGALLLLPFLALPFTLEFALVVKLCIGLLVLVSALYTTHRHLRSINHPFFGCILRYDEKKRCFRVQLKSGEETHIAYGSYSHPLMVVLRFKGKMGSLIIFSDALDAQTFRQLRVLIKHADNPD